MSKRTTMTTIVMPVLLILVLVIVLVNNQQEFPGELTFTKNKVNFGTIPEWEGTVTRTVTARNEGGNPLQIKRIKTGCTYAKITGPERLQPNEEGTFKVLLNPQIIPTDATAATAIFFTDSPMTPQVYLTIVATAKQYATLSADICDFGQIIPETTHKKTIKLCVNAPLNLEEIRLIPSGHPNITWTMVPEPNTGCFFITIKLQAPKKWEQKDTENRSYEVEKQLTVMLTIAFPNERTLSVPISARIVRPIIVHPDTLSYGAVDKNAEPITEFTLSAKKDFKVLKIQVPKSLKIAPPDNWSQSLSTYKKQLQQEKRFKVFWQLLNSPILLREEIKILTTADTIPITIPVYGLIQPSNSKDDITSEIAR